MSDALERFGGDAVLTGVDSGLHGFVRLGGNRTGTDWSQRAAKSSVLVPPVQRYALTPDLADDALILGYAALTERQINAGVKTIFSANWTKQ